MPRPFNPKRTPIKIAQSTPVSSDYRLTMSASGQNRPLTAGFLDPLNFDHFSLKSKELTDVQRAGDGNATGNIGIKGTRLAATGASRPLKRARPPLLSAGSTPARKPSDSRVEIPPPTFNPEGRRGWFATPNADLQLPIPQPNYPVPAQRQPPELHQGNPKQAINRGQSVPTPIVFF